MGLWGLGFRVKGLRGAGFQGLGLVGSSGQGKGFIFFLMLVSRSTMQRRCAACLHKG